MYEHSQTVNLKKSSLIHRDTLRKSGEQAAAFLSATGGNAKAAMKLVHQYVISLFHTFKTNEGRTTAVPQYGYITDFKKQLKSINVKW